MLGIFVQSYDCEGRWGVADRLTEALRDQITGPELEAAYSQLADILDKHSLQATFAFVGAFMIDEPTLVSYLPLLRSLDSRCPGYLNSFLADAEKGKLSDWLGSNCLTKLRSTRMRHEFATHGFTHIPWDWPGFSRDVAVSEIRAIREIAATLGIPMRTFVFPRNAVSHLSAWEGGNFIGYRRSVMWRSRAARLLHEFHLWENADRNTNIARLIAIPGGQFMNIRFGARRLVPTAVTIARWRHIVDSACRSGGVAHLWCHPENFVEAPDGIDVLHEILAHVERRRVEGRLIVMTQEAYCDAVIEGRVGNNSQ